MRAVAALIVLLLGAAPATADLSRVELSAVAAEPPPGARLDLGLAARDIGGTSRRIGDVLDRHPAFLAFVDYTCNTLCGTELMLLAAAIQRAPATAAGYHILVLGLDPKDPPQAASAMEEHEIPADLQPVTSVLLPDQTTIARATDALGFRYAYDASNDQFAHPAVIYVLAPDGRVRRTLSPFELTTADLGQLVAAPTAAGLSERIRLLCYGYDPATGVYTPRIERLLKVAAALTVLLLGGVVLALRRRGARLG